MSNAHLGLANRLAAPFAQRVFLSFPIAGREGPKYLVTGRPIPSRSRPVPQEEGRRIFGLPDVGPVLLVFGGSLGARLLNELALDAFGAAGPAVLHLCGTREGGREPGSVGGLQLENLGRGASGNTWYVPRQVRWACVELEAHGSAN